MSKRSPWDDPNVKAALADGRGAGDIALLWCPHCGQAGYWNQGSHFTCSVEDCHFSASGFQLDRIIHDDGTIRLDEWYDAAVDMDDIP